MIFCIQFNKLHLKKWGNLGGTYFYSHTFKHPCNNNPEIRRKGGVFKKSIELVDEVSDALSKLWNKDYFETLISVPTTNSGHTKLKEVCAILQNEDAIDETL